MRKRQITPPPEPDSPCGAPRGVGVEIEFAGLSAEQAAKAVAKCYGGQFACEDTPFVCRVRETRWGTFRAELDTRFVHPQKDVADILEESALPLSPRDVEAVRDLDGQMRSVIGHVSAGFVPTEIVSPPIPWNALDALSPLLDILRALGAKGTDEGIAYGFGVHLNPEVVRGDVAGLLDILRAYVVLSGWLREQIGVNVTRRILPHVDPFPEAFVYKILDPDYAPNMETFIADYFADNPTRNRELDMLAAFKHFAPEALAEHTDDPRITARPTFHYRLPDTRLSDPNWDIVCEWNRWVIVERLAAQKENLHRLALRRRAEAEGPLARTLREIQQWFETLDAP